MERKIYMTCGIPGSGKSTYIQKQIELNGGYWCSRDAVRFSMLKDSDEYFAKENEVFETWIKKINESIEKGDKDVYIDATHLNVAARKKVLFRLPRQTEITYLYFDVPLEVCLERNSHREGRAYVPETAIINMYERLTKPSKNVIVINEKGEIVNE